MKKSNKEKKECLPCEGISSKLSPSEVNKNFKELKRWKLTRNYRLTKKYTFKDFKSALAFVNKVGEIADRENHHPDIELGWGKVQLMIYTHALAGLSMNDFILASKIDKISKK